MNNQALQRSTQHTEPRVVAFLTHVSGLLVPGERIEAWAIQRRFFALTHRRSFVIATTGRLLVFTRGLLAGYDMRDVRWQDMSTTRIKAGIFATHLEVGYLEGTDLSGTTRPTRYLAVIGLRSEQAQEIYRICQSHDQAWREKRRVRDLEEMRARSGGIQIGGGGLAGALPAAGGTDDPTSRLERAKDMLTRGLITDAEYEALKAKIISGL
jgi:hypothetical protein